MSAYALTHVIWAVGSSPVFNSISPNMGSTDVNFLGVKVCNLSIGVVVLLWLSNCVQVEFNTVSMFSSLVWGFLFYFACGLAQVYGNSVPITALLTLNWNVLPASLELQAVLLSRAW